MALIEGMVALDVLVRSNGASERYRSACPILSRELMRNCVQPMPLGAIRCYLLDGLCSSLACTNGCSCWSPPEGNMAPDYRCKRRALAS
jgi:hypothetical protein